MLLSYAIYFGLLIICGIFSCLADRRNSKTFLWGIILSLTLIAGLRAYSVGLDTQNYVEKFSYIYKGQFRYAYGLEESFKYICYGILHVIPNASFLLGVLALITNSCIILRFWELRKIVSFPCMVLFYYMSFYFMSLNGTRQFVAVAILFWGTRYLGQKKLLRFIICVCIATLFHQTAIVGFLLLLLNVLQWRDLQQRQKNLYILLVLCLPLIVVLLSQKMEQYRRYFSDISINMGLIIPIKLVLWILCLLLMAHSAVYQKYLSEISRSDQFNVRISYVLYIFGLLLSATGYFFPTFIERISWYFYIYEGVFYGALLKNTENGTKIPIGSMIFLLIAYGFWYSLSHNSQGIVPYLFI